ncbi:ATP-dependent Clp protease proteolytic subunit 5, chloroplastic-like [Vicia villosa]|uniref:ATP-dependent Clp protease proteolytic subunit 5, chloroplastic-like n=1 Tax=Vicia villosa TaxID=3911 RepID=UPI00273BC244|nr:ATP-dependent Clp protease proteolytic subunit 5, chloroplastic-like [Vicia villosa]
MICRKLRKSVEFKKTTLKSSLKVVYGDEFWGPEIVRVFSPQGDFFCLIDVEYWGVPSLPYLSVYAQGQGPPPMVEERFQIVISQRFQYRIIYHGGAIDDDMANISVSHVLYLYVVDSNKVPVALPIIFEPVQCVGSHVASLQSVLGWYISYSMF